MNNTLKNISTAILILFFIINNILDIQGQNIPDKPNPPRLVNDYAGLLSQQQKDELERKLVMFNDSTSTQIAVVIVNTLNNLEPADYAQQLGEKWGIGQKGKNNGVVILIKPTGGQGERRVFIAPGYGLEPVIPDATCKLIVEKEMIPYFRQNDFARGIDNAVNVIMALAKKEYPATAYNKKHAQKQTPEWVSGIIILIIFIIIFIFSVIGKTKNHYASGKFPFWTMLWLLMMSNRGGGGNWKDFSSGSGSFGGGGFGGFGGGSFGGGGAGGRW